MWGEKPHAEKDKAKNSDSSILGRWRRQAALLKERSGHHNGLGGHFDPASHRIGGCLRLLFSLTHA